MLNLIVNKCIEMKKILLLVFLVLGLSAKASHILGGWIEAEVINNTTIKVRLKLIASCNSSPAVPVFTSENVTISGLNSSGVPNLLSFTASLNYVANYEIETHCSNILTRCQSNSSFYPGYVLFVYEGIITLPPGISNNVRINFETCCWAFLSNLASSGNFSIYTDLYSLNSFKNNSPSKSTSDLFANFNDTNTISFSFIDAESDSLHYQLANPLEVSAPIPILSQFFSGYSYNHPVGNAFYSTLDSNSGTYAFYSPNVGAYAIAVELIESRNGQILSVTHAEQLISVDYPFGNGNTTFFSVNGQGYKKFNPCKKDTISYVVNYNLNDSIGITVDSISYYTGATLNITTLSPSQKIAQFVWQPPINTVSMQLDKVVFRFTKYTCPTVKKLAYLTKFLVSACPNDSVWPGDINQDKTVNLIDGIYLAAAYNDSGIPRVNPSLNWTPQYALDWVNSFSSGSNHKHADGDGNGKVELLDAAAIAQNFNLTHAKSASSNIIANTIYDPEITFGTPSYVAVNTIVNVPISLGNTIKKVLGTNAVLFKIDTDPNYIDGSTLQFIPNAGIITNTNDIVLTQYKDVANADLYIAFVKKNNGSFSGNGLMGQFNFKIKATAPIGNTNLYISNEQLYGPKMQPQGVLAGPFKTLNIVLGLKQYGQISNIHITPNPFSSSFSVSNDKLISTYEVMDMTGKIILKKNVNANNFNVNTETLNSGIYFIKMFVDGKVVVSKLVKE
jgi:Secretion system C-terminal sorting domain